MGTLEENKEDPEIFWQELDAIIRIGKHNNVSGGGGGGGVYTN